MSKRVLRCGALLILLVPGLVHGDELADLRARNARLEATVEELTVQLADSLAERRRLEAALAAATAAAPSPVPAPPDADAVIEEAVVSTAMPATPTPREAVAPDPAASACDVASALRDYDGSGKGNRALGAWLKSSNHLQACSEAQLRQIRKAVKWDWLGYQKEVLALIDEALEARP